MPENVHLSSEQVTTWLMAPQFGPSIDASAIECGRHESLVIHDGFGQDSLKEADSGGSPERKRAHVVS